MSTLELEELSAGYRRRTVVSGISAQVASGGWLGVIGPNGSGKSTLLKAMLGLVRHEGRVLVDGRAVTGLRPRDRARAIGYAPQIPQLPVGLTVTDYVLLGRTPHLSPLGREGSADLDTVGDVLQRLDLSKFANRPLSTLSGGERQRTVLARALAQRAGVLLLDEPTTGLDVGHAQALLDLVDELRAELGTTVVTTLHDLTLAGQYAERLLLLDQGRVAAEGPPDEVLTTSVLTERYTARVAILRTPDGSPVIAPVRD
ncbi:iron complex transport system ATP-binding protein [Halopolyspora algeriensis]|uniref:Iron complex transport system ATP-binding protein n=1 Tax=Halopolyspora algeriensis TaxID=1500506 RepID=A0A368VNW3_9ACTN|nr:ABC transporter ATP-binding protein [Halopolyspora algeriensis]RCW43210.1 iron complex transport system ATP-binding protein [Halopolyspora algeriensis]TQM56269.1 iron complex transport system ATP-binding protein [Halopolyspora algeriensis]